jgi:hypothetical protein
MPRILTGGDRDDPMYTDVADEAAVKREILDPDPGRHGVERTGEQRLGGEPSRPSHRPAVALPSDAPLSAERLPTHCPYCSKPLDAQLLCAACGDESEMAA